MAFSSVGAESRANASANEQEDGVPSRARLRIAELLQRPLGVQSISLTGLFILALFYTVYIMRSILLPIILALLLSYLLRPIVRSLARLKVPLPIGAAVSLIGLLLFVAYGISVLATPTTEWLQKAPAGFADFSRNCCR